MDLHYFIFIKSIWGSWGCLVIKVQDFQEIKYEKDKETGIVTITLNKPERLNALTPVTFLELWNAIEIFDKDKGSTAMIITGAGEAFSSGFFLDLSHLDAIDPEIKKQINITDIAQKRLCLRMWKCYKPIVAAINGLAIGGAFTMPLACADLIYMSEDAYILLPFVKIAIIPEFACTYLLTRLLGFHKAKEIVYFTPRLSPQRALELGLVNEVLPAEKLMAHARKKTLELIPPKASALTIKIAKRAFHKPLIEEVTAALDIENKGLIRAFNSRDFSEALLAYKEKRDPVFRGTKMN